MNAVITRPVSIPAEIIATDDKGLRKLLSFPAFAPHAQAELDFRMENKEALVQAKKDAGVIMESLGGIHVSYEELLHLATITPKEFYALPEGNIINRLREEVKAHLQGVQSLNSHDLRDAIAELA